MLIVIFIMKKFLILFFFVFQFLNNFLYANENPNNLPDCSNDINPNKWSNCYKYVGYGNDFEYSGTWKNGRFNGMGKIFDDWGNFLRVALVTFSEILFAL